MSTKKNMRKAALTTMAISAAAMVAVPAASAATKTFPDVTPEKVGDHYDAIQALANEGVIAGYPDGTFGAWDSITRNQVASIFARVLDLKTPANKEEVLSGYTDISAKSENSDVLAAVISAGVFKGSNGKFGQWDNITREQMATVLVRALDLKKYNTGKDSYINLDNVSDAHKANVQILANLGITNLKDDFLPFDSIHRAAFASFVYRAELKVQEEEAKLETPKVEAVSATNGKVTVTFDKDVTVVPEGLSVAANGKAVDLDADAFKVVDGKVEVTVPTVEASTEGVTEVTYAVKLGDVTKEAKLVVPAKLTPVTEPAVESVKAVNATQVEVKFNKEVSKTNLFEDGQSGAFRTTGTDLPVVTLKTLDDNASGTLKGKFSADDKTLTITSANPLSKRYQTVLDNVTTKDGKSIAKYDKVVTFDADTTAPTIIGTEKVSATQVKVKFSEPVTTLGNVSFKDANGTPVIGITEAPAFNSGDSEVTYNLSATTVPVNKEIIATFVGVQDAAGNVISPNPGTVTFQKGDKDGVAPTVAGITQTGAKKFTIKFSEPVQKPAFADITVNGTATTAVEQVGSDSTTFEFTTAAFLDGAATVASANNPIVDLSGETSTFSRVIAFVKDQVAPKVTSTKVAKENGKEYLEVTFDKDVVLSSTSGSESKLSATGKYVDNYITKSFTVAGSNNNIDYKDAHNKKVVRVELDTFLGLNDVKDAAYDLDLTFAHVESVAGAAVTTGEAKFTRGEDGPAVNTSVVKVSTVAQGSDNNKVNVTFDQAVDGASATNPANYKVDGAVVESVTLAAASGNPKTQVATLNLKKDSNTFSGTRNVTIENVKAMNSYKVMEKTVKPVSLQENVRPTVTSAKLTGTDKVTVTFSEAVISGAATSTNDFELLIGGSTVATNDVVTTPIQAAPGSTTLEFTLEAPVTAGDIVKGLALKPLNTLDITDTASNNGNVVNVSGNITITQ